MFIVVARARLFGAATGGLRSSAPRRSFATLLPGRMKMAASQTDSPANLLPEATAFCCSAAQLPVL